MTREVISEHNMLNERGDTLECGLIRINNDRRAVAFASLGDTSVTISRGQDGKVRIEIDDIAEEDVYIHCNLQTLRAMPDDSTDVPWTDSSALTYTRQ